MTARRPRVALVSEDVGGLRGGVARVTAELVTRCHDRVEFVVVSRTLAEDLRPLVEWRRVRAPAGPPKLAIPAFLAHGGLQVRRARADLVHVHSSGALVGNHVDLNTVHFSRAAFQHALGGGTGRVTRVHLALERWCMGRARRLGASSRGGRLELEALFPGSRVVEVPNGVDADRFRPDREARKEVRAELGAGDDQVVALFVGNAFRQKGLAVTIEALGLAAAGGNAALRQWVAGYGDADRYAALARAHGVGERVRFLGVRDDIARVYAAADLLVLPTVYETFCLVAWEAAATELPLVVTLVNGLHELVGDGRAGIAVDREPRAVADALLALAGDPGLRGSLGSAGRRIALDRTWDRTAERTLEVYRELGMRE
jgi:glycosyltransferase involved in cell wall biosynthesis